MPATDPRWQAIDAKLPLDHHARIVRRQVEQLDRTVIDQLYHGRGKEAFDPVALLAMVLYQYLKGRRSPASWEERRIAMRPCSGWASATRRLGALGMTFVIALVK